MTTYRSNARFISKKDNIECYEYRGVQYNIELDNQVPVELQHKYEQDFIDYTIRLDLNEIKSKIDKNVM